MISGRVSTARIGLITAFAIPSTAAPMMYAHQPLIVTLLQSASASQSASALTPQATTSRTPNDMQSV